MKKIVMNVILISVICNISAQSQDTIEIPEPDFTGVLYVNTPDEAIELETQRASYKSRAGAAFYLTGGWGRVSSYSAVIGVNSPVRIRRKNKQQFIVTVENNSNNPSKVVNFFQLEKRTKKNKSKSFRYVKTANLNAIGQTDAGDIKYYHFIGKKYGNNSYLITTKEPLEKGEYAITLDTDREYFYMFGID